MKQRNIFFYSIKLSVFLLQFIFALGFSFSQNAFEVCCHKKKMEAVEKKHSCCAEESTKPIIDHCNSDSKETSFSACNCIHSFKSSDQETTFARNFELTKFVNVQFVATDIFFTFNKSILTANLNSTQINSPPLFINNSSLLI